MSNHIVNASSTPRRDWFWLVMSLTTALVVAFPVYDCGHTAGRDKQRQAEECLRRTGERYSRCLDGARCACQCDDVKPTSDCAELSDATRHQHREVARG